ncbi:hypothetical protein TEA_014795 [Camellia sinensis var. sinensis]|uniref:TPM domain-containing protein n=1 Tax=Camellia sinensis var. sinensis TaxID=542762 RepID=A0A4S4ENQ8_CAMSN|nr:hypothetical protein TEA_014795 [Camellia sinensis var. sinensis]
MAFLLHLQPSLKFPNSSHPIPTRPSSSRLSSPTNSSTQKNSIDFSKWVTGFRSKSLNFALSTTLSLALSLTEFKKNEPDFVGVGFAEGKVGVNKPELLPEDFSTVIDVAGFLSDGQEKRISQEIADIEKDTGFKLRVLAQNYPDTPGLAIKDYWQVDDRTVIFVADPTFGRVLQ